MSPERMGNEWGESSGSAGMERERRLGIHRSPPKIWEEYPRLALENAKKRVTILLQRGRRRSCTKVGLNFSRFGTSTLISADSESRSKRGRSLSHLEFIHVQLLGVDEMIFLQ